MIGRVLGHYRLLEPIGAGGMGEVYRAYDSRLERDVALKILPAERLGDETVRRRFRKEAFALSRLSHPHIATVHDFDTQDGIDFLVMELIPGQGLEEKLRAGPLPEKEVVRLGAQLARGLMAAHEHGVVHRDLKPANLRLTEDGLLKILDFGLALVEAPVSDKSSPTETAEPAFAGTVPYMAPEQMRGRGVDSRTDIYAAGNVLYEMATGERPFAEARGPLVTEAILHQAPDSPRDCRPELSSGLEFVILKALEKEPERRYQSAKELLQDLERVAAPAVATAATERPRRRRAAVVAFAGVVLLAAAGAWWALARRGTGTERIDAIAVLPLKNLMGDTEQEYFVEGMHEALTTELSKISALKVISRTSTMRYKDTDKPLPQIARELDVEGVIEGSVLREGNQVRITVQLIHGPSDRNLWAESFDRELRGILALHSDLARAIAREVRIVVTPAEEARLSRPLPVNPEAYEAYLKGQHHLGRRTEQDIHRALRQFEAAVHKDPGSALGHSGLADVHNYLSYFGLVPPREGRPKAKVAALRSLEIDPNLAEAHVALARVLAEYEWDWAAAEREFKRAIELNPGYPVARQYFGMYLSWVERHQEAIAQGQEAVKLDPLSIPMHSSLGTRFLLARQYKSAMEQMEKALDLEPNYPIARLNLGTVLIQERRYREGIEECEKAVALAGPVPAYLGELGYAYARAGRTAEARSVISRLELSPKRPVSAAAIARVYSGLGERSQALAWLERAIEERSVTLFSPNVDPAWDPLRPDPRFQELLRRMKLP